MKNTTYPHARGSRISNAIKQFKGRFYKEDKNDNEGAFFVSDILDIMELSGGDSYELVTNSLMAGFMIGYRKGRRDAKA